MKQLDAQLIHLRDRTTISSSAGSKADPTRRGSSRTTAAAAVSQISPQRHSDTSSSSERSCDTPSSTEVTNRRGCKQTPRRGKLKTASSTQDEDAHGTVDNNTPDLLKDVPLATMPLSSPSGVAVSSGPPVIREYLIRRDSVADDFVDVRLVCALV